MTEKTIFRLRALCFCDQEAQHYPLSLTCTDEALITDSARLMRRMKELEGRLNNRLCCCQMQELPFNQLYSPYSKSLPPACCKPLHSKPRNSANSCKNDMQNTIYKQHTPLLAGVVLCLLPFF